jgi:hypothetical protein
MKTFRTLRGFLEGSEPDEDMRFAYSAALRISGLIDAESISQRLGLQPTHVHRKGESRGEGRPPWRDNMWSYESDESGLSEAEPLERHINHLWSVLKPHKDYLLGLKKTAKVDVFLGYRSNCDHAGIEVPHTALEMFRELQIPFGLSIIIA